MTSSRTQVGIIGQGFSNATGVKFGSGAGTFTAVSDTYMIATVAAGIATAAYSVSRALAKSAQVTAKARE